MAKIIAEIRAHLNDTRRGEILRDGFVLTVIGPPNSGKSSLINALAQREVAIVSDIPGTTRDVVEVHLDLGGYPVIVADTAGLRETADRIEAEGVRRALVRIETADAVLLLLDATMPEAQFPELPQPPSLTVWNKADVAAVENSELSISVRTGAGMDLLLRHVGNIVRDRLEGSGSPPLSRERHRHALMRVADALSASLGASEPELAAEEIRVAMRELGRITGCVDLEELLDVVFHDFCIGK